MSTPDAPRTTPWQAHIHGRHLAARDRVILALDADGREQSLAAARKIEECGRHAYLVADDEARTARVVHGRCRHRLCPTCAGIRRWEVEHALSEHVQSYDHPAMVTLTLRSTDDTLSAQLDRLLRSYRRLRQTVGWRRHCSAGIAVVEITWSQPRQQWHPHLHVLAEWVYWPQASLSAAWSTASGGSPIVDVRRVASRKNAAAYLAKYAAKGIAAHRLPPERIPDLLAATASRRLLIATGTSHNVRTRPAPRERDSTPRLVTWISVIVAAARDGDALAQQTYRAALAHDWSRLYGLAVQWTTREDARRLADLRSDRPPAAAPDPQGKLWTPPDTGDPTMSLPTRAGAATPPAPGHLPPPTPSAGGPTEAPGAGALARGAATGGVRQPPVCGSVGAPAPGLSSPAGSSPLARRLTPSPPGA